MLVACVIFALITVGLVIPCVIDIATTPSHHFDLPNKQTWLIVAIAFWAFGAAAWLLVGRREVRMHRLWDDVTGSWVPAPQMQHPAARARRPDYPFGRQRQAAVVPMRFVAPDDNPDFLLELDRRIREWRDDA
jgi:uncharacterized membrane protein